MRTVYGVAVASSVGVSVGVGEDASSVGAGVSVGSAVTDGLGFGVVVSSTTGVSAVGVAVSIGDVGVASTVAGVLVACGAGVLSAVAVGVGVLTLALLSGVPPRTLTALVWAWPEAPSPRTAVDPLGTQVGTLTLILALPVLLVVTVAMLTNDVPFFHRIATVSWAA